MTELYQFVYYMELPQLVLLGFGLLCAYGTLAVLAGQRFPRAWRLASLLVAALAVYMVYAGTLRGRVPGEHVNYFIPFQVLFVTEDMWQVVREAVLNTLLFVPLGATLPFVLQRVGGKRRIWPAVAVAAALSLTVELLQLTLQVGHFQTDDLLLNSLGCLIGTLPYGTLCRLEAKKTT